MINRCSSIEERHRGLHIRWLAALVLFFISYSCFAAPTDAVLGEWKTPEDKSKIEIYKCGNVYCGKIVWLKEPKHKAGHAKAGQTKLDDHNPDLGMRSRSILGLELMHGFRFDGDDTWEDGKIYDPENGKTYSCKMSLENSNTLKVRGYIGISLIGRTSVWTR